MELSVLGPLQATIAGGPVAVRRGLPRALAVLLILRRRAVTPAEVIVDRLWSSPPGDPGNAVQRVVSYLRRALGPDGGALLVTRPPGYALLVDDDAVDAARFERLIRRAQATQAMADERTLDDLNAALALWRGEPLADVAQYEWASAEIARLDEMYVQASEARLAVLLQLGRPHEVVTEARALIATHPLREDLHAELMIGLYRTGRQSEALQTYASARRLLADELGLDPGPRLRDLERRILAQDQELHGVTRPDASAVRPPAQLSAAPPRPTRIAMAPTSLVGRQKDLDELDDVLARTRLLTLTGPGGVGKTRLAGELAQRSAAQVTWFVDLSVLSNDGLVVPTVARAVGAPVTPGDDVTEAVVATIGSTAGLLLLDNCEHVVEAASALASRLLRGCPNLVQITTSRRPLRVAGEVTWPVPPLGLPPPGVTSAHGVAGASAAELFLDRATAVRPDLTINDANAADIAAIVRCVDGLPLAIELAAAHADVLTVDAIRRRLADHFDLLESDVRDLPARQRTLRVVIDSSVDLLTGAERRFFVQLGAFAGSFDLEAAAAVTVSPPALGYRLTASLVRQSLVVPTPTGRYRLLESLRAYAAEALAADAQADGVRRRHLDHLVELMTAADQQIRSTDQEEWLVRIREIVPDVRAALRWSLGGAAPERGALLAAASAWYCVLEGMLVEAREWIEAAQQVPALDDAVRAAVLQAAGAISAPLGELTKARDACAASIAISRRTGNDQLIGKALVTLGIAQWALGDLAGAAASHDEALDRLTAAGDTWYRTAALALRARTAIDAGDDHVDGRIDAAIASARHGGEKHLIGLAESLRARRALLQGDARAAFEIAEQCLAVWRLVGYQEGMINATNLLGRAATALGRLKLAEDVLRDSLRTAAGIGHRGGTFEALECLAAVFHGTGRDEQALILLAIAERERRCSAMPTPAADAGPLAHLTRRVRQRLGSPANSAVAGVDYLTVDGVLQQLGLRR